MYKRIIFALLYKDNNFFLSRNFRLQKVGDINWLKDNFGFNETCNSIDELICLNIKNNPSKKEKNKFIDMINKLRKTIFIPLTLGGGIRNKEDAKLYFNNGADKISINSKFRDYNLIKSISEEYGSQSVTLLLDYKKINKKRIIQTDYGQKSQILISDFLKNKKILNLCGELILNSIDNDGVGTGLDLSIIKELKKVKNPLLIMGGAGKPIHIIKALKNNKIKGVVTANLFNFLGTGLNKTREILLKNKLKIVYFI